ncbi:alcohol dehydrogenase family protein [Mesorhizobium sp. IMUNJ 23033]|uniref:alcohol dehydrogenase family protein n=1 Tax=Mesorhizobium sp. IMUNJ 23033 TaxID=3378039 RepID=UPI0038502E56
MPVATPDVMKAMILTGHGEMDKLVYVDNHPVPRPGDDEVLIRVSACAVNNTDIWVRQAAYGSDADPTAASSWRRDGPPLPFPRIQGCDTVGTIVSVGPDVSSSRVGERVLVDFNMYGPNPDYLGDIDYIGHGRDGGYAEYMTVPALNARQVNTRMSDVELSTFCCAYHTGEHMLDRARVSAGERVLVTGASGGVGSALVQLCRARGAVPYAAVSSGKEQALLGLGAEAVITRGSGDLFEQLLAATGGELVDVVADVVGGEFFTLALRALRPHGRYTTAGAIGGPVVQFDLRTLYIKHLELHGSSQGSRHAFDRVIHFIEQGRLRPVVAATYRLSNLHRAQEDFMRKSFVGKLVVVPDAMWHQAHRS